MRGHIAQETPDMPPLPPVRAPIKVRGVQPYILTKPPPILLEMGTPRTPRLLWLLSIGVVLGSMIGFLLCFLV